MEDGGWTMEKHNEEKDPTFRRLTPLNMTIVEMCVHMDCAGCESKIRKALQKLEGVDSVEVDMARQKVTVAGHVEQKKVLKAVRRAGRRAVLWPFQHGVAGEQYNFSGHHHHQQHPALQAGVGGVPPSSSYNYYKHGHDDSRVHGYCYQQHGAAAIGDRTGAMFSDENPDAYAIM